MNKENSTKFYVLNIIVSMFDEKYNYQSKTHSAFLNDNYEIQRFLDSVDGIQIFYNGLQLTYSENTTISKKYMINVIKKYYINEIKSCDFFLLILNGEGYSELLEKEEQITRSYKFQIGLNDFITAKDIYEAFEEHLGKCPCGLIINSCHMDSKVFINALNTNTQNVDTGQHIHVNILDSDVPNESNLERTRDCLKTPVNVDDLLETTFESKSSLQSIVYLSDSPTTNSPIPKNPGFIVKSQVEDIKFPFLIAGLSSKNVIYQNLELSSLTYGGAIIKGWNAMQLNLRIKDIYSLSRLMLKCNLDKTIYSPSMAILCNKKNEHIAKNILKYRVMLNGAV